ncbi:methyltransferase domain-containing protein [Desulfovibrio ferrophilus]|uniref:Methyltransferase type 11 n=1 Tax=Desulfovibrio ferrophilus TaxID=241368 RepID=A0A2Z6B2T4_9BACT|nr:methyltransferase domain-containing protein [Desulfovibrio ferrophilus]BBD09844.1 methyltransferase type 11 [Desulfovibrio ferrophilus]
MIEDVLGEAIDAPLSRGMQAEVEFTVRWSSDEASHEERYLARKVDPHRDFFPPGMDAPLKGAEVGTTSTGDYIPGKVVPGQRPRKIATLDRGCFKPMKIGGRTVEPVSGRFYPYQLLGSHPGIRTTDVRPAFRVVDVRGSEVKVDFNHPLAARHLAVEARLVKVYDRRSRGKLPDWMEEICMNGPGMQARTGGLRTKFDVDYALQRQDEDDSGFYAQPRQVDHVDKTALRLIREEYTKRLSTGAKVLDLMSSKQSHLPEDMDLAVTGLGMNVEELGANTLLMERLVHDLNAEPALPFGDASFDNVVNSLSVEYLTNPRAVTAEVLRVLRPGGQFMVSFSNRWFPEKVTALWTELHDFERMGLVLDYLLEAGFKDCWTVSIRNHWRPKDDPHFANTWDSDPVFVVGGVKTNS